MNVPENDTQVRLVFDYNTKKIQDSVINKTKEASSDYADKLGGPDGKVDARSLYFNSRDLIYKTPFGAVTQGTEVTYKLSAKANDLEKARLVVQTQKITGNQDKEEYLDTIKYPMKKVGVSADGTREYWQVKVKFNNINVYGYYFEAVDGNTTVIYGNNNQVVPVPHTKVIGTGGIGKYYSIDDDKFARYTQTVYDKNFKTPDWAKDTIYYYIFPDRFKDGDKSNDPQVGVRKFHGKKDIEFHTNWLDKPYVPGDGKSDKEYCNDFFGGDLAGVKQKLDYLKQLGISTIYFNPLFQADSNHKYDTADYMHIDEEFGTNAEFSNLCQAAKEKGIRVILDTSLNHSGSASVYMDKFGTYGSNGALKGGKINTSSPYYSWYKFHPEATNADSMYDQWSDPTLATLQEVDSYKNFAFRNDNSVTKYWLKMGASGWRMDVAPWKSDEFWREWRKEVKEQDPNALTICETWFDSSKYFLGDMFDSTMNYIFRTAVIDYANGGSGKETMAALEMMRENYPKEAFYSLMNLLSTHDVERTLYDYGYTDDSVSKDIINTAKKKLALSALIQMTYPGAPAIYYGDEVGVTGGSDPFNRGTYPWKEDGGNPDTTLLAKYEKFTKLRNNNAILRRGDVAPIYSDDNVMVMLRTYEGKCAIVAVNNAATNKKVTLDLSKVSAAKGFKDALNGGDVKYQKQLTLTIPAYYGNVLISK